MKLRYGQLLASLMTALLFLNTGNSQENNPRSDSLSESTKRINAASNGELVLIQAPDKKGKRSDEQVQLDTNIVNVIVSVTDTNGRLVTGLSKDHFEIYDDRVKQEIDHFSNEDSPVSLGIVFDVSGSMKERMSRSVRALRRFIETSHTDDQFFLIAFSDHAELVKNFTSSGNEIANHLNLVKTRGSTALYDAAYLAVEKVAQGGHNKKALLIISDGQDNNSRYSYKELRDRVQEADVVVYAIGITDPVTDSFFGRGRSVLQNIAQITGGRAFFPDANSEGELVEICTRIALELRRRYSLGFYPSDRQRKDKWHRIDVNVLAPKGLGRLSVAYRDRYQSFDIP